MCIRDRYQRKVRVIILDSEGNLITKNGRALVNADNDGLQFPWYPPAIAELDAISAPLLNDKACCILFLSHLEPAAQAEKQQILREVAAQYRQTYEETENSLSFLYALNDPVVQRVKDFAKIETPSSADSVATGSSPTQTPVLTILDLNESFKYLFDENTAFTASNILQFLEDYEEGNLPKTTFKSYDSFHSYE
eukprot:TRINITY_DN2806_c0_g1_i2.p1 TRINITY_DN2806_c0_g1~~TRINITY_DN2806_c0_g1_i2.p1  ORF type:complete len:194 (+),score=40.38 TRINITY_DN2806_c0_g1_i2:41-622(+)